MRGSSVIYYYYYFFIYFFQETDDTESQFTVDVSDSENGIFSSTAADENWKNSDITNNTSFDKSSDSSGAKSKNEILWM